MIRMRTNVKEGAFVSNETQKLDKQELINDLTTMWRIRLFEEALQDLYEEGALHGTMHLCMGQEATAVGGAGILQPDDWMISTHRNHGHGIAKGTDRRKMFAEILGKKTGTNQGKGGSMHIADLTVGNLGSNGIVGAGFPIAAGAALTAQMQGTQQVVLCYAGDGATNEGSFHEALNLASIWQLPVIYLIENNQYGMSSSIEQMVNIERLSERGRSYGIAGVTIDGNDLELVKETVTAAITKARNGGGPTLIEALTYRYNGHSKSDKLLYRTEEECAYWQNYNDPILRVEQQLMDNGFQSEAELRDLEKSLRKETLVLLESVRNEPTPTAADLWTDVYQEAEK